MFNIASVLLPHFVHAALEWIAFKWESFSPYLFQILLGAVAFVALLKDWRDYGKLSKKYGKYVPLGLAIITVGITFLGIQETYQGRVAASADREQAKTDREANQAVIRQLTSQVQQLREDNKANTDGFRVSFDRLYSKFSELQSKVQNKELSKELADTKQQLLETQKKLTTPKAAPTGSFPILDASLVPKTEIALSRQGTTVTVQFFVYNPSEVPALNGTITLRICEICSYAEEPSGFVKLAGASQSDREFNFQHIFAKSGTEVYTVKVTVPLVSNLFAISTLIACETCVPPIKQDLWITLQ